MAVLVWASGRLARRRCDIHGQNPESIPRLVEAPRPRFAAAHGRAAHGRAAHAVLVALYPAQVVDLSVALSASLAAIPNNVPKVRGYLLGTTRSLFVARRNRQGSLIALSG